jgi:hypothetical protein
MILMLLSMKRMQRSEVRREASQRLGKEELD